MADQEVEIWKSVTRRFVIDGHKGYVTLAKDSDGCPIAVEICMAKQGSTLRGLLGAFADSISIGLRHGIPIQEYTTKLARSRFEPEGWTKDLGYAASVVDYVCRWIERQCSDEQEDEVETVRQGPAELGSR